MANQIAQFFEPYGREEAVSGVAGHLRNFWDPRMRSQLIKIVAEEPELVHEVVRAAVRELEAAKA